MATIYEIDAGDGLIVEIEGDRPPTKDEASRAISRFKQQQVSAAPQASKGFWDTAFESIAAAPMFAPAGSAAARLPAPTTPEQARQQQAGMEAGTAMATRVGGPIAVGMATGGLSIPGQMLTGGGAGAGSDLFAQLMEMAGGKREEIDWGNVVGAGIRGAAPIPTKGGVIPRAIGAGGMQAGGALAGRTAEEERLPTIQEAATEVGLAGGLGTIIGGVSGLAAGAQKVISGQPLERAAKFREAGIEPTIGQLFPSLAATEQRIAVRIPGGPISEKLQTQSKQVSDALRALTPGAGAGEIQTLQDLGTSMIEVLGARGGADYKKAVQLFTQAQDALATAMTDAQRVVATDALERMRGRIQGQIEDYAASMMRKAEQEAVGVITPGFRMTPAAGGSYLQQYGQGIRSSFNELKQTLYEPIEAVKNQPVFEIGSIKSKAVSILDKLAKSTEGEDPLFAGELLPALRYVKELPDTISLQQLRDARETLFELSDAAGAYRSRKQGQISQISKDFSDVVKAQAVDKYGSEIGNQLLQADATFARIRPKFSEYGVASLFKGPEFNQGTLGTALVNDILSSGSDSSTWRNIKGLVDELQASGAKNVPSLDDVKTIIRQQITGRVYDANLETLNVNRLANFIGRIENATPGFARELGFGDPKEFALLQRISDAFPNATSIPADQFIDLLRRSNVDDVMNDMTLLLARTGKPMPSGLEVRGRARSEEVAKAGLRGMETEMGRYMARMSAIDSAEDAAALRKLKLPLDAEQKLAEATDMAKTAGTNLREIERQAAARRKNPILAALDLVDEGVPVSVDDGEKFFKMVTGKNVEFVGKVQEYLSDLASKGNKQAGDLLNNWKQRAMEDVILDSTKSDARGEFIDARSLAAAFAESDLRVPDSVANRLRVQIGKEAFDQFKNRILPALRLIGESQQEAAQAGATVRGRGPEAAIEAGGAAAKEAISGRPLGALERVLNAVVDFGYTQVAARIFSNPPIESKLRKMANAIQGVETGTRMLRPAALEGQLLNILEE